MLIIPSPGTCLLPEMEKNFSPDLLGFMSWCQVDFQSWNQRVYRDPSIADVGTR